jgi:hypothetical protein
MGQMLFANPGFELQAGLPIFNWANVTTVNTTPTVDTSVVHGGIRSLKLVNTAAGEDSYYEMLGGGDRIFDRCMPGVTYTVTAWLNCSVFTAGALSNRGLMLREVAVGTTQVDITSTTAGWVQLSCSILAVGFRGIAIRLYSPQGTVNWDDVEYYDNSGVYVPHRMPMVGG